MIRAALEEAGNRDHTFAGFPTGNHLMLEAETGCDAESLRLKRFVPGYYETMLRWALTRAGTPNPYP